MPQHPDDRFCREARPLLIAHVRKRFPRFTQENAEDAVQTAYLNFFRYLRKHEVANPLALLYTMTYRAAVDLQRQIHPTEPIDDEHLPPRSTPDGELIEVFLFEIADWVRRRHPADVRIFQLRGQGHTHEEIAGILGLKPELVRQRHSRLCREICRHFDGPERDSDSGEGDHS